ncbi:uncharacterized protein LAESUDRAFT_343366 [Laetiporus sulphureus 93-53]|uniref:Enhancer of polycomb-like protein n=1 Tax=Laetiporus sulphureus 93-53 TaxID=1314785 RepID=A0A165GQ42_9APHY|nr:uncharacterized protein LAESUDRAFT_343366 [Laetiporus sulphureus 93-53]KZT10653.1 hypothetical protein LAESUDRAFT_343366 [Laetiporus sulphureus 93-53]
MPRNHVAGPSTLRNRNRVTNKTRLKVITENIDADTIVLDEDEEKARVVSTAGVDAEDANEHHLQAVLSAAATRHQASARSTRGASEKERAPLAAYIPTPDSTGIVENYEQLYPPGRWKDPCTYVKSSDTVEESTSFALANGFIYYMDERDKEWLDKNNEEARGEGTSAQGAISASTTRSVRSMKAKGKEPDVAQSVAMLEDEFELVMAIFEKVTHEKTEFLHHGLEQGAPFPPFSEYQDTFAAGLQPAIFAIYEVPSWIPPPAHLTRLARTIYPHWRERRLERCGHPIIPSVNLDETDTINESYICFRRREIKAIRKTRAQQATYSDKMVRLKGELAVTFELANSVLQRETIKRDAAAHAHAVWDKRFAFAEMKRKFPTLSSKDEEELLYDRERVVKKPKLEPTGRIPLKLRTRDNGEISSPIMHEPQIRPKERQAQIQKEIDQDMARRKEKDHQWEDAIDNPYQPTPTSYASKLFKYIGATCRAGSSTSSSDSDSAQPVRAPRAGRLRFGRGGRLHLDRRMVMPRAWLPADVLSDSEHTAEVDAQERARRLAERWQFDSDDVPAVGPEGSEEKDRVLVDDYEPKYLVHHMTLLTEQDHQSLITDATVLVVSNDGRQQAHLPFRLGQPTYRRDMPQFMRPSPLTPGHSISATQSGSSSLSISSAGTPVAFPTQLKKMPPPAVPQTRTSGSIRPPGIPAVPSMHPSITASLGSPRNTPPITITPANGVNESGGHVTEGMDQAARSPSLPHSNGHAPNSSDPSQPAAVPPPSSPLRPKAQVNSITMPAVPNGYHMAPVSAYTMANAQYMHPSNRQSSLTLQQMHELKSAFASMSPAPDAPMQTNVSMPIRTSTSYVHALPNNPNYMRPMARQMQWAAAAALAQQQQRPPSVNAAETNGMDGMVAAAHSPQMSGAPARTPSANGIRAPLSHSLAMPPQTRGLVPPGRASPAAYARVSGPLSPSPHLLNTSLSATQPQSSPTRSPQPPMAMPSPSPSLQARHAVGSMGAGY